MWELSRSQELARPHLQHPVRYCLVALGWRQLFPCRSLPPLPHCGAGGAGLFMQVLAAPHQSS